MPMRHLTPFTATPASVIAALDSLRDRHAVPAEFSAGALAEAEAAARSWAEDGPARLLDQGARDARDLPLVTIDPPGSMDLDQALLLERIGPPAGARGEAVYRVSYAIASLATFVEPGGALDAELAQRGSTVYAPDRSTPLHPEVLSHGAASLLPDVERPACLWTIELDAEGRHLTARVERAVVRSRARLSYAEVQAALEAGPSRTDRLPAAAPSDLPELLREVGGLRQRREAARGGVSLGAPEQEVERVDPQDPGSGYRLVLRAPLPVEGWNAQISLLTGICAAEIMVSSGAGILRTMPPAQSEDYARLRRVAAALGVDWPASRSYPELLRGLDGSVPAHVALMDQAASLFRGAGYLAFGVNGVAVPGQDEDADTEEAVHAAIAARYAHVTAPLRRLVDRYGEELCVAACAGRPVPGWVRDALPGLPEVMEVTGRRARAVTRGALGAVEALVLQGRQGEVFDGVITSVREGRGEVVLADPAVIGSVRAAAGRRLPVGQAVRVRLVEVDLDAARVDFELA
ncbi:MAG: RNB domain-containing ribonuclease [Actinomyces sp.]|uniref:RNB domain-containing ribonuclease n=1 Tax=Actinomyces sp. TaxID=29317 RepID=UPI0026DB4BEF|nr:RNB domain-containing ribonuclease [Actinomyces sp.]MDO4243587.1 RNB domain-containing ribonuclease [Actinomyces sp.]